MDRDNPASSNALAAKPMPADAPAQPVIVSVCVTCKTTDTSLDGPTMYAAVKSAIGERDDVRIRPVQCLSVCKRPATVAITSPDGYTFLFGDLQADTGAAALASFVRSYQNSDYGLVPWRERAEVLRKGMVARVPPIRWSPDDGRAPK